jgi:hypothetical protein
MAETDERRIRNILTSSEAPKIPKVPKIPKITVTPTGIFGV